MQFNGQRKVLDILEITDSDVDTYLSQNYCNVRSNAEVKAVTDRIAELIEEVNDPATKKLFQTIFALEYL
jgi:predicted transcriptional regulator